MVYPPSYPFCESTDNTVETDVYANTFKISRRLILLLVTSYTFVFSLFVTSFYENRIRFKITVFLDSCDGECQNYHHRIEDPSMFDCGNSIIQFYILSLVCLR